MRLSAVVFGMAVLGCRGDPVEVVPDTGSPTTDAVVEVEPCVTPAGFSGACPDGMALIPGGCYRRVDGRDAIVAPFCLDIREVTLGAYRDCSASGACVAAPTTITKYTGATDEQVVAESKYCNAVNTGRADHPINCVDFNQAVAYCKFRGGARLPTSDEWEWEARGGPAASRYPWGDDPPTDQPCWAGVFRRGSTCVAGSSPKDQTVHGIRDMGGNLFEWVATESPATAGWRVQLGGSFGTTDATVLAVGHWYDNMPEARMNTTGFRCAK